MGRGVGLAIGVVLVWLVGAAPSPLRAAEGPDLVRKGEPALTFAAGFVRKGLPEEGYVLEASGNKRMYGSGDRLYLKLTRPQDALPGSFYTIYRTVHEVFHPWSRQYLGNLFTMVAVVRVTQVDGDIATIAVERLYDSISPGYGVVRFEPPSLDARDPADRSGPSGTGTVVDIAPQQTLVGKGSAAYIDWGRRDGLRSGDRLQVYRLQAGLPLRPIGTLKVLHLEDATATTLIIKSTEPLQRGDRVAFKEPAPPPEPEPKQALESGLGKPRRPAAGYPDRGELSPEAAGGATVDQLAELTRQLEFQPGQVLPTEPGLQVLDRIAGLLRSAGDQRIRIEGHADDQPIGPALLGVFPSNQVLSLARAEAVAHYFVEKGGLDPATLSTVGMGETRPVASNRTEEGRKKNRRIEIVLQPAGGPAASTENR